MCTEYNSASYPKTLESQKGSPLHPLVPNRKTPSPNAARPQPPKIIAHPSNLPHIAKDRAGTRPCVQVQRPKLPKGSFDPKRTIRLTNSTQRGDPPVPTPQRRNAANHSTSTYSSSQKGQKQVHVLPNPQIQFIKNCSCVIPKMANLITKRNTSQRPRKPFHIHLHTNHPSFTYLFVSVPVALLPLSPQFYILE